VLIFPLLSLKTQLLPPVLTMILVYWHKHPTPWLWMYHEFRSHPLECSLMQGSRFGGCISIPAHIPTVLRSYQQWTSECKTPHHQPVPLFSAGSKGCLSD
jgi:hypothetical protein